jgi:hypothetical protein
MQDRSPPARRNHLQRTAGPYIRVNRVGRAPGRQARQLAKEAEPATPDANALPGAIRPRDVSANDPRLCKREMIKQGVKLYKRLQTSVLQKCGQLGRSSPSRGSER